MAYSVQDLENSIGDLIRKVENGDDAAMKIAPDLTKLFAVANKTHSEQRCRIELMHRMGAIKSIGERRNVKAVLGATTPNSAEPRRRRKG